MDQQRHTTKSSGPSAICELNALNRTTTMSSGNASTPEHTTPDDGIRPLSLMSHRQPMLPGMSSISRNSLFSATTGAGKLQMSLNPRYISKITNSSSRKVIDTSLRMRPYFIPERSRTKSENSVERDGCIDRYTCASDNFQATAINFSSNASMMETCDGYGTMDATANNSTSNSSNTSGFYGMSAFNILQNSPFVSGGGSGVAATRTKQTVLQQWKKSKSLEDVRAENIDGSQPSHEMEFVSSRIQKLKVQE